jgi:hypothetical protein
MSTWIQKRGLVSRSWPLLTGECWLIGHKGVSVSFGANGENHGVDYSYSPSPRYATTRLPPPLQSPTTVHVHLIIPSQNFSPPRTAVESTSDLERFHLLFFGGYLSHFCLSLVPWGG